jgi:hypothetical protein
LTNDANNFVTLDRKIRLLERGVAIYEPLRLDHRE